MQNFQHTNKLIKESSPYLIQHAHNPVNWYPWGQEALDLSKKENKPILVSIGYSACHWCHVMERESFEDEATAQIMNDHFINIKIDREERPDLDHIYMDAVQAMTGSGGWPLNVFLTPEGKPFFGGTYFPPKRAFNRLSWKETLLGVQQAFQERRNEIDAQAENLIQHLVKSNSFGQSKSEQDAFFDIKHAKEIFDNIMKSADKEWGGFGKAPKFPQTFTIQCLLRYYHISGNREALNQALLSIDKMIDGGIYDQIGGGFARYSTDSEWLVPHFEKMLYDNALLVSVISEAYQLTSNERYKKVIEETIEFVKRELMQNEGGFYAALDADSEGVEGKYYVWSYEEVIEILGKESELVCSFFDITPEGNWEHNNIPWRKFTEDFFCNERGIQKKEFEKIIETAKKKLLQERNKRIRPATDDKILLGWNALMNTALCKAFAATGNQEYRQMAIDNMDFLLNNFRIKNEKDFYHTWKNGQGKYPAFLDDLSFLVQSLIQLQEVTGNVQYLFEAKNISDLLIENFEESTSGFFYFTNKKQEDIIVRKKEIYDGAQPSGNSIMSENLYKLSFYFDLPNWKQRTLDLVQSLAKAILSYPNSFGIWASLYLEILTGTAEIAIVGSEPKTQHIKIIKEYLPHKILMLSDVKCEDFPLLKGKPVLKGVQIYYCFEYVCSEPVSNAEQLFELLRQKSKFK